MKDWLGYWAGFLRWCWRNLRDALSEVEQRFVAWSADLELRGRAGLFGTWPWQSRPKTTHVDMDMCSTRATAEQVGRLAAVERGADFAVVRYLTVEGQRAEVVVDATGGVE